ncbi:MAG: hypothetical protein BAJALOKI1v1_190007 [Promethearchaeota archaeon]|nr:MAG: hypothetical protein BAJALOKI1v1_190007 [Candidatus Lokiarchaeota archaeon]
MIFIINEEFVEYSSYLLNIRDKLVEISKISDITQRHNQFNEMIVSVREYIQEMADAGNQLEAGELAYSIGTLIEKQDKSFANTFYEKAIKLWAEQIKEYNTQGKLHEISELYLRIAELYNEQYKEPELEREYIRKSIKFLIQEADLLEGFNEGRKLAQIYQNIAELYLKISDIENAIIYYTKVIKFAKENHLFDILPYSYRQVSYCYKKLNNPHRAKEILVKAIDFFLKFYQILKKKNDHPSLAQVCQILKNLYRTLREWKMFNYYSKKEAGAYIDLAEDIKGRQEDYHRIARYYRGAALCYKDTNESYIDSASCFLLAGNYCEQFEDYNQTAINYFDSALIFRKLKNYDLAYKLFMKAGDNYAKIQAHNSSCESYLYAYEAALEGNLEFNRFGLFNQLVRELHIMAKEGLKNKQFYKAATLILESIKFYEQLDNAQDFLLKEMIKNTYKYYYRAANLKELSSSHILDSYAIASLSLILIGKLEKAREIINEIELNDYKVKIIKEMIDIIIGKANERECVVQECFPEHIQELIEESVDISYLISLFEKLKPFESCK